ncbi:MAG: transposase zinc-binding domain-containing protein [Oligoflexales bacterium]|nr:transposase zinc-binding domain-containing protein [Oligoflexales bacterium]
MEAAKTKCTGYTQRRPELTPCYKIIQNHLDTFIANRESEARPLPGYVLQEFDAYLKCGIHAYGFFAYGFFRLKCLACQDDLIVAFSCKKRGFCPSCAGKRMTETAAHLVDNVLPYIPYRQFVVSFPIPLRYWLNTNKKLYSKLHSIIIKEINQYYISKASCKDAKPGSISFTQRFGSALNLKKERQPR